jgi:IS5 family transposase
MEYLSWFLANLSGICMGPKSESPQSGQLFGYPLLEHLNPHHPLLHLAKLID